MVLRLLDEPTDDDHAELSRHPNSKMLASWLLELPAYRETDDFDDEDEEAE
ncbi:MULTISPECIES: hypothetical protein [unclassified Gordonia (in: high G+C Gram-positive bacteria)]|uniref:hypothetical protein n=1 Tax=unclassified Gordonia (in: high G+C Gram-positive bacteria) TaxID=2657482 RepID=UPI0012E3CEB3|nr:MULTISPECIES: hypothetical protein [unclassified Gordonia (in: high G+C Gram-positive bacteria)]